MSNQDCSYGRSLPQVLDKLSSSTPGGIYTTIPRLVEFFSQAFIDTTVSNLARCVNALA